MSKREVLDFCNKAITLCNGKEVTINDAIKDAELDNLGSLLLFGGIRSKYGEHTLDSYEDFLHMTVKAVVNICVLSS